MAFSLPPLVSLTIELVSRRIHQMHRLGKESGYKLRNPVKEEHMPEFYINLPENKFQEKYFLHFAHSNNN